MDDYIILKYAPKVYVEISPMKWIEAGMISFSTVGWRGIDCDHQEDGFRS